MKTICIALVLCCFACTKRNEALCCNDEADCMAKDIPIGSMCDDGLVCRGNQCIAIPCGSNAECDASAPYCIAGACAEACTEDAQCPGAGQDPTQAYCVDGSCVVCRSSTDCSVDAPVCAEDGSCRACAAHSECASDLCEAGTCVSESLIAYVSPTGSTMSTCTIASPCTLARAIAVIDATRNIIRLQPGTHTSPTGEWRITTTFPVTIYGPAMIDGPMYYSQASSSASSALHLRDVSLNASVGCLGDLASPLPTLSLESVQLAYDNADGNAVAIASSRCKLTIRRARIQVSHQYAHGVRIDAAGAIGLIERSELVMPLMSSVVPVLISDNAVVQMSNSVVRNASATTGAIGFGTQGGTATVTFSTLHNSTLQCPASPFNLSISNSILLNEVTGAASDTITGPGCPVLYSLIKPQGTPRGTTNLLGMDPKFVSSVSGDFHLVGGSVAIDAADPAAAETVDFDGTVRPQGARRDIGAFEYKP